MAKQLSELCTLLVDDLYGELSSQVFATLSQLGRVSIAGLLKDSHLSLRQLKHGLAVLVQQHLALHYTPEDEDTTYYEANWQHAYSLVRAGKIIQCLEDRYGEEIGALASNLLLLGHTKVNDLADAYGLRSKRKAYANLEEEQVNEDMPTNGLSNGESKGGNRAKHIQSLPQLHAKLRRLLSSGYILPVQKRDFYPSCDNKNEASLELIRKQFPDGVRGPKKQAAFREELNAMMRKRRDEHGQSRSTFSSLKRDLGSHTSNDRSIKRRKLNGNHAKLDLHNGASSDSDSDHFDAESMGLALDGELVIRINYEKCDVALRGQLLVSFAAKYLGDTTAKVYHAFLQCLEEKIPRCLDEYAEFQSKDDEIQASPSATNEDVLRVLDPSLDLSYGMPTSSMNGVNGLRGHGGLHSEGDSEDDVKRPVMNESHTRAHLVDTHMHLLSSDPRQFVSYVSNKGGGEWKVDFRSLTAAHLQDHLESTVESKFWEFGPEAAKVVRILFSKGKLDEKQVAHFAMFRQKDVRAVLTHLQEAGYVDCQEVPKDNSRTVNKTMFFWFFDQDRCRKLLLSDTYKAMARILQRIKVEREYIQPVIDKAERLDVVGREEEYLTDIEKNALKDWSQVEEKLLTQLSRLDDSVGVLRDFYMPPLPS